MFLEWIMVELIKRHWAEICTFAAVGVCATATHYFTALALIEWFAFGVQLGNFFGFWTAFCVSYLGQSLLTFKARPSWVNLVQYLLLAGFNFCASALLLQFLTSVLSWNHRVSLLVVVAVLPLLSFVISKKIIFKK